MATAPTIVYVAGHSGGHIIPLLSLIEQEKEINPKMRSIIITSDKMLDTTIVTQSKSVDHAYTLPIRQQRRWYSMPLLASALIYSFFKSCFLLIYQRPSKVVTSGSIVALPVCLAAFMLRIPIELWEVNPVPGKVMRFLAPLATSLHICFAQTKNYFTQNSLTISPYPLRSIITKPTAAYINPTFSSGRITLFVQGGSQGSQGINQLIITMIENYPAIRSKIQIIHQTGPNLQEATDFYARAAIPAHLFAYDPQMAPYYRASDIVICRSGAGTLFETIFFKKPCLTIPLERAGGAHQIENAQAAHEQYPELITIVRQNDQAPETIYRYLMHYKN